MIFINIYQFLLKLPIYVLILTTEQNWREQNKVNKQHPLTLRTTPTWKCLLYHTIHTRHLHAPPLHTAPTWHIHFINIHTILTWHNHIPFTPYSSYSHWKRMTNIYLSVTCHKVTRQILTRVKNWLKFVILRSLCMGHIFIKLIYFAESCPDWPQL